MQSGSALAGGTPAQVQEAWTARYDGSASSWDEAGALAVDSADNVYVTGKSGGIGSGEDIVTLKYDPFGNLIWERRYNGSGDGNDWAAALAVASAGNVYVAGSAWASGTASDLVTLKYDPDGNLLWDRSYNGPGNLNDVATALTVDHAGNVFVAGESEGDGTFNDFITLKYDANGNLLWARRYNGLGNGRDGATALAVDGAGNLYVTGLSAGTDAIRPLDYATLKYDPSGELLWVHRLAGAANENDIPHAIAVDDWGDIYVTGELGGFFSSPSNYGTVKYDPDGNSLWLRRYNGPANGKDIAFALAVDGAGNLYVTGYSQGAGSAEEAATLKYDADGNLLWEQRHDRGRGTEMAVDNAGQVYVAGTWLGFDGLVLKYSRDGTLLWNVPYAGRPVAMAMDAAGDLYVAGVAFEFNDSGNMTNSDYLTAKYAQLGCPQFVKQWPVDVAAVMAVAAHWGEDNTAPDWDHRLDVNRDGVIDVEDVAWVAGSWHTTCDLAQLPGPADEPAGGHIPDVPFPEPDPADYAFVEDALAVSFRQMLLMFEDATTVQQANDVLASIGGVITGGLPDGGLLLVEIPTSDLDEMTAILNRLNQDPRVAFALMDMGGAPDNLPPHNVTPNLWTWELPVVYPTGPANTGNWGLELIRAPQMWNLDAFVRRNRAGNPVSAGIIDGGFQAGHADLQGLLQVPAKTPIHDHGTHGAGIIGARHNGSGVEGVNPWLTTIRGRKVVFSSRNLASWGAQLSTIIRLLKSDPSIKVINNSYGLSTLYRRADQLDDSLPNGSFRPNVVQYGDLNGDNDHADASEWGRAACGAVWPLPDCVDFNNDNTPDTWRQVVDRYGDLYKRIVDKFIGTSHREDFFLVASAGNQSRGQANPFIARDDGPLHNAAVRYGGPFLAVESMNQNNVVSNFSFQNGSVAAPGECIRSTEANDGTNFDSAACGWSDGAGGIAVNQQYATQNGTSFSAPHVTGLIAALWKLEPNLTPADIRALITGDVFTVDTVPDAAGYTARRIDAFAAAMGIDSIFGGAQKTLQRALVDVDDGTRDGNLRFDPLDISPYDTTDTGDQRRGDGQISMRDFRAWRDAYLQVHAADFTNAGFQVSLDGPNTHFKKDLNFDGCVGNQVANPFHPAAVPGPPASCANAPDEVIFPRYDFNGDGQIAEWFVTAPFKDDPDLPAGENKGLDLQSPPGLLRDIDVLADMDLWNPVEKDSYTENVVVDATLEGANSGDESEWNPRRYLLGNRDPATAPQILKDLPDYIHSFDLHIQIHWNTIHADYEAVHIIVASEMRPDFQQVFKREIRAQRDVTSTLVATIPLWTGKVRIGIVGIDDEVPEPAEGDEGYIRPGLVEWAGLAFGEDRGLHVNGWPIIILDWPFQQLILPGGILGGDLAIDEAGNSYVAFDWLDSASGLWRLFVAAGGTADPRFTITEVAVGNKSGLEIAAGPAGSVYGVYSAGPGQGEPRDKIMFVRSTDGGQSFSTQQISTLSATGVDAADVTVDASGTIYLVWVERDTNGIDMVKMRTSADGGQSFSTPVTIYTNPEEVVLSAPKVRVDASGQIHVTWLDWTCLNPELGDCAALYYSRSSDGQSFSIPITIGQYLTWTDGPYQIAVNGTGTVSVVYARDLSMGGGAGADLRYVRIEAGQVTQSKVIAHSTMDSDGFGVPSVAVDSADTVWAAWTQFDMDTPQVFVSRSTDGGANFSTR